jgi:hypothetical protein
MFQAVRKPEAIGSVAAPLKVARHAFVLMLIPLAVACGGQGSPAAQPKAAPAVQQGPAVQQPAMQQPAMQQPAAPAQAQPAAKPTAAAPKLDIPVATELTKKAPRPEIPAPDQTGGIALGQPLLIGSRMAAIQVTNTTDSVKTFTVRLSYKQGEKSNELSGTVIDLRPKQTSLATLNTYSLMAGNYESASLAVTGVKEAPTTPKAEATAKLTLGEPTAEKSSDKATVQVTNGDKERHTFTVRAGFFRGGELVGYGEKQVLALEPGKSETVKLVAVNDLAGYDEVKTSVISVLS